ncbi:MAG: hypothetical protein KatS3mg010_0856 [Acidimicrobiia bacterium]|nr:MAG: hypothetical protein KatS3mg010_0856 [Acidimicrobiia bacterium]
MTDRGRRRRAPAARGARIGVAGASVAGFATLLTAMPLTAGAGGAEQAADPVTRLDWSAPATTAPTPQPRRVVRVIVRRHVVTNDPSRASQRSSRALPSPPAAPAPVAAAPAPPSAPSATAHRPAPARTHGS